ncbi:MAG: reprolysin-like metallopeptidase [Bacteroidia bacterium]
MKSKLLSVNYVLSILGFLIFLVLEYSSVNAQENKVYWQTIPSSSLINLNKRYALPEKYVAIQCNTNLIRQQLSVAPMEFTPAALNSNVTFKIPMPDGSVRSFKMVESMVMDPTLAANFSSIKTYSGQGIEERDAILKVSISPIGFHAMILSPKGSVFIDPIEFGNSTDYIVYFRDDFKPYRSFNCELDSLPMNKNRSFNQIANGQANKTHGTQLRNYRLALACTGEYAAFYGGTTIGAMAGMVASMNRVNGIYESELAVRMTMVANNNLLIYLDANTDPYTNTNGSTMLGQNVTTCNSVIGSANYDIGHVFSTGGGGVAYLGVPCTSNKAGGVTGLGSPVGDAFDVDYVAHEMGHQFGGSHTFNASSGSCSGNRSASAAYEPGSGITIMAYAGICSATNNLAPNSIAYFHTHSFDQITNYITTGSGNSCPTNTATGNTPPVITPAGLLYTIPYLTPFSLTASGTDANGDAVTFSWEEYDLGASGNWNAPVGDAPIFRPFSPTVSGTRIFPKISDIVNNVTTIGEILPSYARTLKFRITGRDNRVGGGGVHRVDDTVKVNVINTGAAFAVTAPNTAVTWTGGASANVAWNVSSTNIAPISCANVNILLSTDGGFTFPITLLSGTPNDGTENVLVPAVLSSTARVKVEGAGNIFFDISNVNFTIVAGGGTLTTIATNAISPLTLCPSQVLNVDFVTNGVANAGNVYSAQLSNASGSFASPTIIGTLLSTSSNGTIACTIPGGSAAGAGYRIRVVSSLPNVLGTDNGANLSISGLVGATGTISGSATVCQGQTTIVYSIPAVVNATNYVWSIPVGFSITAGNGTNSITVSVAVNAVSGNITVTPSNPCYSGTVSSPLAITVSPLPAAAGVVSGPLSSCQSTVGLIYSVLAIANATSYSWTLPIGMTISGVSTGNSITVNVASNAVSGAVSVSGQNSCGAGTSSSLSVTINNTPAVTSISAGGPLSFCSPNSVNLSYTPVVGLDYQWRKNGVNIIGATTSPYNATQSGNYDVIAGYTPIANQQFNSTASIFIPDNSCTGAVSPIVVSGYSAVVPASKIYIRMSLTHTYVGDLDIFLESPSGERLGLSDQTGNAGNGGDNFTNTVFADSGATILPTTGVPYTGLYKPWNAIFTVNSCALTTTLTTFASLGGGTLNPNGTWNLKVYDRAGADTGRVVNWSIHFPGVSSPCTAISNSLTVNVIQPTTLSSFNPASGSVGSSVVISGTNLNSITGVQFNGINAVFVINNTLQITATVPPGATTGLITLVGTCNTINSVSNYTVNTGSSNLNLFVAIEGFYIGGGNMVAVASPLVSDTVTVQLRNTSSPYSVAYTTIVPLNLNGQASIIIPTPYSGNSYYIAVKHRNSIETWSKFPVMMLPVVNYSFKN